jgi:hypothetical protein
MKKALLPLSCIVASQSFGCSLYTSPKKDLLSEGVEVAVVPQYLNRKLDLLFVVDNSGSMREEQESLFAGFRGFLDELGEMEGGLPDLHVAVTTTDVGAGPFSIEACDDNGDNGRLVSCGIEGAYIEDLGQADGTRSVNYEGTLTAAFECHAKVGIAGCGFEQPLEAMRRALNGSQPENAGFLRDDAHLAVIIVSDEDDCSAADLQIYNSDPAMETMDSELGYLSSFRCFEFGVVCEGDEDPRAPGERTGCKPAEDSPYLHNIGDYVQFLRGLKQRRREVFVGTISGNDAPVNVVVDSDSFGTREDRPALEPTCISGNGEADPAVRLTACSKRFGQHSRQTTICNESLLDANSVLGESIRRSMIGSPCLYGRVHSAENCVVEEVQKLGHRFEARAEMPICDNTFAPELSTNLPCYEIGENSEVCPSTATNLMIEVEYGDRPIPDEVDVVVTCAVEK